MREAARFQHGLGVNARSLRESGVELERRRSSLFARLIGQDQKLLLGLGFVILKGNVGSFRGYGLQGCARRRRLRCLRSGPASGWGAFCRGCHGASRGLHGRGWDAEQKRQQ
jgi:hypothetical protein